MAIWCSRRGGGAIQLTRGCCAVCAGEGGCCAVCAGEVAILRQDIIKYKDTNSALLYWGLVTLISST